MEDHVAVVVTSEKRFLIHTFGDENTARDMQRDVDHWRILKLLGSSTDKNKVVALGTYSANQRIMLLELTLPQPKSSWRDGVEVVKIASLPGLLYGDEFVAQLSDPARDGGERFVLVAALVTARRQRAIYKVRLDDDEEAAEETSARTE